MPGMSFFLLRMGRLGRSRSARAQLRFVSRSRLRAQWLALLLRTTVCQESFCAFTADEELLFFTFQRGANERMVDAWVDGPHQDRITETRAEVVFPGVRARQARVPDPMNGTEQDLNFAAGANGTFIKGVSVKDYPMFIMVVE